MYTPCSVAGRVSIATGPQLVVMVGEMFVHMVVVVVTTLELVCHVGMCWVVAVSIATKPQLAGEQVLVMYIVVVSAGQMGVVHVLDVLALMEEFGVLLVVSLFSLQFLDVMV